MRYRNIVRKSLELSEPLSEHFRNQCSGRIEEIPRKSRNINKNSHLRGFRKWLLDEGAGIRTRDLRIKSPLLYRLSYAFRYEF